MHSKAYKNTQSTSLSKWDWNGSNLNGKEQFQNYGLTIKKSETKTYKGKNCCIIILMQIIGAHFENCTSNFIKNIICRMMLHIQWVRCLFEVVLNTYFVLFQLHFIFELADSLQDKQSSRIHNYPLNFLDLANLFNQFYTKDLMNFLDHLEYLDHLGYLNHLDPKDLMDLNLLYFYLPNLVFL